MKIERIYHSWDKWEDYKCGFYDNVNSKDKSVLIKKVIELFNSEFLTKKYMDMVINEWTFSCEHNLTNESMNKIAYIGQGACCLYASVPNLVTMNAWKHLDDNVRLRSDKIAKKTILKWMQKQKLKNIPKVGKKRGMSMEYQMKLQLN